MTGNPLDLALLEFAEKKGLNDSVGERVELIPFDYSRRRMSVVVKRNDKYLLISREHQKASFKLHQN